MSIAAGFSNCKRTGYSGFADYTVDISDIVNNTGIYLNSPNNRFYLVNIYNTSSNYFSFYLRSPGSGITLVKTDIANNGVTVDSLTSTSFAMRTLDATANTYVTITVL
jgi:hypothetical protein